MFNVIERENIRERILEHSKADKKIVAAAYVGGTAEKKQDRWSDLDLTFGVAKDSKIMDVLDDWTAWMSKEFKTAVLFDLTAGSTVYRVFLTPTNLQVDLSFSPQDEFGARGPQFKPLFGKYLEVYRTQKRSAEHLFGLTVHHLVRARICIEREKFWQADYWISAARDETLTLMCLQRGLRLREGRGYDDLPSELLEPFKKTLVGSLDRKGRMESLGRMIARLLDNSRSIEKRVLKLEGQLQVLEMDRLE